MPLPFIAARTDARRRRTDALELLGDARRRLALSEDLRERQREISAQYRLLSPA